MDKYGISRCFMFCLDEPGPASGLPRRGTTGRSRSPSAPNGRLIPFVRPRPRRGSDRRGDALPRPRRARDQAPSPGAEVPAERRAPRADLRARRRARACRSSSTAAAACRRSRTTSAALVERYPDAQLIVAHAGIADLAALAGSARRQGRRSSTRRSGARSTCSASTGSSAAGAGASTRPTIPTGQQPASLLIALRTARLAQLERRTGVAECWQATPTHRRTASRRSSRRAPKGTDTFSQPIALARIHQYLSMATPLPGRDSRITLGVLGLRAQRLRRPRERAPRRARPDPRAA